MTKYDPAHRDRHGAYTRDEWILFDDIGRTFGGVVLTEPDYRRVEDAYASAAVAFLREAGMPAARPLRRAIPVAVPRVEARRTRRCNGLAGIVVGDLADKLVESLEFHADSSIQAVWVTEANRRRDEVRDGSVQPIPGEDALAQVRRLIEP